MRLRNQKWTNESVLRLAEAGDPVQIISQKAQETVVRALDSGWGGPPFDPVLLAEHLGLDVIPRDDVRDARIVPTTRNKLVIQYNPNRPPARVRYSIAHEIAHTFFPDCGEQVRHREHHTQEVGDQWQLEALCNIAAAELLMPIGSLDLPSEQALCIDNLMDLRKKFHVSSEALLIRVVNITNSPCAMFCASRVEAGRSQGRYRLDYMIGSRAWSHRIGRNTLLPENTALAHCTAIGYTGKCEEDWGTGAGTAHVEAVAIPGYPGSTFPRVVGIVTPSNSEGPVHSITILGGDVMKPRGEGCKIIAHVVNDQGRSWGGHGFAAQLRNRFPQVARDFRDWASTQRNLRLENIHCCSAGPDLYVASMIAQKGYGPSKTPRIRYAALRSCLAELAIQANNRNASVHMPRIGTGQAGGVWSIIADLVNDTLCRSGIDVFVYDRPGVRRESVEQQTAMKF
ncbi:protein of unknown function DUF955 [Haliangium ochraceum DSM 14365]|uniref:Macro domain-containing protein n=1 Tax=Haliangium ochraceum (strain DSM 14365 / JCM 11303 / SMP-2) TaxID=502025 RepID=D0LLM9_HALO1|nr:protein of unknown function DUF955 [Haliangium ochraceum DSM 14365]